MTSPDKDHIADALDAMSQGPARHSQAPPDVQTAGSNATSNEPLVAPDRSVFAPKVRAADLLAEQRLRAQRTVIPILLTCGLLLPAVGSLKWLAGEDTVFAQWSVALPVALGVGGILLLCVAAIKMLHVRDALKRRPPPPRTDRRV